MLKQKKFGGFTLIELMVVLIVFSLLAGLAAPVVTSSIKRAKESALKQTLYVTRTAIDDYFADKGHYPSDLSVLIEERYLRRMPFDPLVDSDLEWDTVESDGMELTGIVDIKSSSPESARDGSYYSEW